MNLHTNLRWTHVYGLLFPKVVIRPKQSLKLKTSEVSFSTLVRVKEFFMRILFKVFNLIVKNQFKLKLLENPVDVLLIIIHVSFKELCLFFQLFLLVNKLLDLFDRSIIYLRKFFSARFKIKVSQAFFVYRQWKFSTNDFFSIIISHYGFKLDDLPLDSPILSDNYASVVKFIIGKEFGVIVVLQIFIQLVYVRKGSFLSFFRLCANGTH